MTSEMDETTSPGALRQRAWRRQRRASRRHLCLCCGRLFIPGRSDTAYCCPGCRQLAYRRRRVSGIDASRRPTDGPWLASASVGPPSPGRTPEAARGEAVGPRDRRTGKLVDLEALIG